MMNLFRSKAAFEEAELHARRSEQPYPFLSAYGLSAAVYCIGKRIAYYRY